MAGASTGAGFFECSMRGNGFEQCKACAVHERHNADEPETYALQQTDIRHLFAPGRRR
jgi:hypothetical protein